MGSEEEQALMNRMPEFGDGEPDPHPVIENDDEQEAN